MFKKLIVFLLVCLGAVIVYAGQAEIDESLKAISNGAVILRYYNGPVGVNYLRVNAILNPNSTSSFNAGIDWNCTATGTVAFDQVCHRIDLTSTYSGPNSTSALRIQNSLAGTGNNLFGAGLANFGIESNILGTTTGTNVGISASAKNGIKNYGIAGFAATNKNGGTNIGGIFVAANGGTTPSAVALYATLGGEPALSSFIAASVFDNGATGKPIIVAQDNGTAVWTIDTLGNPRIFRTITAAGTTGAQTINKPSGTVNFAAAATTLVVTNSLVDASSIIHAMARTNDGTCHVKDIEMAVGSFTIRMTAACTAETSVGFLVTN